MKRSEWNDEQLENFLSQMPKVKDNRNPQEIYQNISLKVKKRRRPTWIVPSLAAVAAVVLLLVLSPSLLSSLNNKESSMEESTFMAEDSGAQDTGMALLKEEVTEESANERMDISAVETEGDQSPTFVIREEDLQNKTLLTYTVPLENITFFTTVSLLTEEDGRSAIEKYNEYIPLLNNVLTERYDRWGLETFALDYISFTEENDQNGSKIVIVNIPSTVNPASFSSAEAGVFSRTIQSSFSHLKEDYTKAVFKVDGVAGIEIGQTGEVVESFNLEENSNLGYFLYTKEGSDQKFLVYSLNVFNSVDQAFEAMKSQEEMGDYILEPTIPLDMTFEVNANNERHLTISITSPLEDSEAHIMALEAMMLTAKEFGFQTITFEGDLDRVGEVMIGTELQVPIAPNLIEF